MKANKYLLRIIVAFMLIVVMQSVSAEQLAYEDCNSVADWVNVGGGITSVAGLNGSACQFDLVGDVRAYRTINTSVNNEPINISFAWQRNGADSQWNNIIIGNWTSNNDNVLGGRGGIEITSDNDGNTVSERACGNFASFGASDMGSGAYNVTFEVNSSSGSLINSFVNIYMNGVLEISNCDFTGNVGLNNLTQFIMAEGGGTSHLVDDIRVTNSTAATGGASDTIGLTGFTPTNGESFFNATVDFNVTGNFTTQTNCSLVVDSILNLTTEYSSGNDTNVQFFQTFVDGNYSSYISCTDVVSTLNTTTSLIYVDSISPSIDALVWTNNKVFINSNVTGTFNLTDESNLFSYNVSVDGTMIDNKTNINNLSVIYNLDIDPANYTAGEHTINITIADGHTDEKLKQDYKFKNGLFNDYLKFEFDGQYNPGYVAIYQKDGSLFDSWDAERKIDRYNFKFKPNNKNSQYTFIVEAQGDIHIVENPNTKYQQWLIYEEHWLDFMPYKDVKFKRISNRIVEVTVKGVDPNLEEIVFNSIGDLNIISQTYTFFVGNVTSQAEPEVFATQVQNINLTMEKGQSSDSTTATLIYNGTSQVVTKTAGSSEDLYSATINTPSFGVVNTNVSYTWNYSITSATNTEEGSITANQSVLFIGIDNCSVYTTTAINFSLRDFITEGLVPGTAAGYFEASVGSSSIVSKFNLSWGGSASEFAMCINPASAEYEIFSQIEYTAPGYNTNNYYLQNTTVNNVSQTVNLYLTNANATPVVFTVLDEGDNKLPNVFIKVLKYDLPTDSFIIQEVLQTDSEGQAVGQIILSTQFYKFILERSGEILFESEPTVITSTSKTFRVTLGVDYFQDYAKVGNVVGDVTFTNATKTFSFTYSDTTSEVETACLRVDRTTVNGVSTVNSTCVDSASGTINLKINEDTTKRSYVGVGYVVIDGEPFTIDSESVSFDDNYKTFGLEGVMVTFIVILTLTMVGVSSLSPIVAVSLMMVGLIFSVIATIFFLNWPVLIVFVIIGGLVLYRLSR